MENDARRLYFQEGQPPKGDFLPEDDFGIEVGPKVPSGVIETLAPHERSQVLSGALFAMVLEIRRNEEEPAMELDSERWPEISVELAEDLFDTYARDALTPLLYLPPGELEFADFIATYLALDDWSWDLSEEALRRGLAPDTAPTLPDLGDGWQPEKVLVDDDAAREFVEARRDMLGLPPEGKFEVLPRIRRTREVDFHILDEIVLKVRWERQELNPIGAPKRALRVGTMLAFDLQRQPTAFVKARPPSNESRRARDAQLIRLRPYLGHGIDVDETDGALRVHQTMRSLHILGNGLD